MICAYQLSELELMPHSFSGGAFISVFGKYFWNDSTYMTLAGRTHHIVEVTFKAFTRALRQATEYDPRGCGNVPS
ncbi:hypothetical protein OROGR_025385 [Orobanche gracilis]